MSKTENWPARVLYALVALALAVGLLLTPALPNVGASPDESEWETVATPTGEYWKLAPGSNEYPMEWFGGMLNYAGGQIFGIGLTAGGTNLYVVGLFRDVDDLNKNDNKCEIVPQLLKSTDGGATWTAKTDKVLKALVDEGVIPALTDASDPIRHIQFEKVATDPLNADFVIVSVAFDYTALPPYDAETLAPRVVISDDGGSNFHDTGSIEQGGWYLSQVHTLATTVEVDKKHDMAISGIATLSGTSTKRGVVFRLTTGLAPGWVDATRYAGWDDAPNGFPDLGPDFQSMAVPTVRYGIDFATHGTVLVTTVSNYPAAASPVMGDIYLQVGTWGKTKAWNAEAGFTDAVLLKENVLIAPLKAMVAGITLPLDSQWRYASKRYSWVNVNYIDPVGPEQVGEILRVLDDDVAPIIQQIKMGGMQPWLTNVAYWGYIESGKAVAGIAGNGTGAFTDCGMGVQVYRNSAIEDMDVCCRAWRSACKPPTGRGAAAAFFVSDKKALGFVAGHPYDAAYDESALSWSFDDGDTWNQLSLIDTHIDFISDVALSPNCNKHMLVTINSDDCNQICDNVTGVDSVWLMANDLAEAPEYSGTWIRTWSGKLEGDYGLLRLAPEEENGDTVYLVDWMTNNVYWNNMETLACWEKGKSLIDEIVDLAVMDEATIYALGYNGAVSVSDDHGATASWERSVSSKLNNGHTIAVKGDWVIVGGESADVSVSDDAGETFTELARVDCTADVHVAFDSYSDENSTIYVALAGGCGGVYRWVLDESSKWKDLGASNDYDYYGIVLDNAAGNPMTDASTGGVLYAAYVDSNEVGRTGVARILNPAEELCCDEGDWDYLHMSRTCSDYFGEDAEFAREPSSLKICGCLSADSNTRLWAVDSYYGYYDRWCCDEGSYSCCNCYGDNYWKDCDCACYGRLWTYEDCFSKGAPDLVSIADGSMVPADDCYCINEEIILKWERMCNACSYDIQIALDEDFVEIVLEWKEYEPSRGAAPSLLVAEGALDCNETYYWRVRASDAETKEIIHSWWSSHADKAWSFTVEVGPSAGIQLTSPDNGVTNVPVTGISFTWTSITDVTSYDWVLSANADLSSPVESKTGLTSAAYTFTGTLDKNKAYYWQVNAKKDGVVVSQSQISTFTTAPEKPAPPPEPAPPKTPTWVWVIIAIGAILVIVVIVLIFRTRRV